MAPRFPFFGKIPKLAAFLVVAAFCGAPPAQARRVVHYETSAGPGSIVIDAMRRRLFFVLGGGRAIEYPVGVGKRGWEWSGSASVNGKYVRPDWVPPQEVLQVEPFLPRHVRGGAPNNPMGARAITLDRSEVAIHGSTRKMRATIGGAASHGCIRMYNEDVIDLYSRVQIGAPVLMLP